jgi:tRNA(Ile)-lysidine synthetase-like protein
LLSIPGEVLLDTEGWAVSASPVRDVSGGAQSADAGLPGARNPHDGQTAGRERQADWEVAVRGDLLKLPLVVRSRRPGDRFRPAGMTGRKKLQDFLVDRKVPREKRDSLPLVVDGEDRIVWVVGHAVSADFGVTAASQGVILLKARRLGGLG